MRKRSATACAFAPWTWPKQLRQSELTGPGVRLGVQTPPFGGAKRIQVHLKAKDPSQTRAHTQCRGGNAVGILPPSRPNCKIFFACFLSEADRSSLLCRGSSSTDGPEHHHLGRKACCHSKDHASASRLLAIFMVPSICCVEDCRQGRSY